MNPVDPGAPGQKIVYAADQPPYLPLISRVLGHNGIVRTRWQLTDEERRQIADGADLVLDVTTYGRPLQPLHLELATEPAPVGAM